MNILKLGKLQRHCDRLCTDPMKHFYDYGTQMKINADRHFFAFGATWHRHGFTLFLGPLHLTFFHRVLV